MCGIAGILLSDSNMPNLNSLQIMAKPMSYRGPDNEGYYRAPHIGLVHRRLAIRDVSEAGNCPMGSDDDLIQLVFNGEIYNWRELKVDLENAGMNFNTRADSEVVLNGYQFWGIDVVKKLRGMFSFAIWDGNLQKLVLARDRVGEKPLFFANIDRGFIFSSTIASLKKLLQKTKIDPLGVAAYLSHGFIPASQTIFKDINVLPPAHYMFVDLRGGCEIFNYWDFPRLGPAKGRLSHFEKEVELKIEDSVVRCLDADVPVGVFLSGGVDSSLIAAQASRHYEHLPAFTLGFKESSHNELNYAAEVAKHLGLQHHTIVIDEDDVIENLPHLVRQYGQPFGDSSALPTYCLARMARREVKVCLSGDGADESFGGYWRMQAGVYAAKYGSIIPGFIRRSIVPALASNLGSAGMRLKAINDLSLMLPGEGYGNSQSWYDMLDTIAGPKLKLALDVDIALLRVGKTSDRKEASLIQKILYDDFQVQLPDAYLTKVDVASMAASLEVRSPFLDHSLLEMAWVLPDHAKLNFGRRKWLLKKIASKYVPHSSIYRPKMGFAMPLAKWFRGRLGDMLGSLLDDSIAISEGWLNAEPIFHNLQENRMGRDHSTRLWLVLWLELWFRMLAEQDSNEFLMEV